MRIWPTQKQWEAWSLPSKLTAIGAYVGILSILLFAADKAWGVLSVPEEPEVATVPDILVRLANSGDSTVTLYPRNDFIVWFPPTALGDSRQTTGRFELHDPAYRDSISLLRVDPHDTLYVTARILNAPYFGQLIRREDTDMSLIIRYVGGGMSFTDPVPFTEGTLNKYYIPVDVGLE